MSSIHILNKGTKTKPGGGLPIYDKLDYIFSKTNSDYQGPTGLWVTPNNVVPKFQVMIPQAFITSFVYHETRGNNDFTGNTFAPASNGGLSDGIGAQLNGSQVFIYQVPSSGVLIVPAPDGRWVGFLTVNNGLVETIYYTEEFVTKNCCG